jgi:broad specificity phosphatase PhoE
MLMSHLKPPLTLIGSILTLAAAALLTLPAATAAEPPTVVFLLRHAEKEEGPNPPLSDPGRQRAQQLAELLAEAGIGSIHSTDYPRSTETVRPLAERLGLEILLYDPAELEGLATRLRAAGGRHVVVGHSNTTPTLVELLGGSGGAEIDEAGEFDRLYIVAMAEGAAVSTVLLRYGEPFLSP